MKLIAGDSMHAVKAGEAFETSAAEACRLITYGFATPAHPCPGKKKAGFRPGSRRASDDATLAAALRSKVRAEELQRFRRCSGSAGSSTEPTGQAS